MMASQPLFLFAPGAGAPSSHPWMRAWAERLQAIGHVRTFDYDYMRQGRRRPDPPPLLIAAHRHALRDATKDGPQPVILIGKSMGGRFLPNECSHADDFRHAGPASFIS